MVRDGRDLQIAPHVLFEVLRGIARSSKPEVEAAVFRRIGERLRVLPFDRAPARLAARMAGFLDERGTAVPDNDLFIAASAMVYGDGAVITDDREHFARLAPFGLTVLPW